MTRPYLRVAGKLAEARFFYGLLASTPNPQQAAHYFSAFVSAARSVTFTLQAVMANIPGFNAWYETERLALARNAVAVPPRSEK